MSEKMQLKDYLTLRGTLRCVTGLRIGGAAETIEIGGLDNPIIKHPLTGLPYVPGSSLKGKVRALLELRLDKIDPRPKVDGRRNRDYGEVHRPGGYGCEGEDCPICRIFGSNAGEGEVGPARLIVRDAYLTNEWEEKIQDWLLEGKPVTEIKYENTINRITAMANPRQMERVPAGMEFAFEIGYRVFDTGDGGATDRRLFQRVIEGLRLVQSDTLGGSGSRGYGKVAFQNLMLTGLEGDVLARADTLDGLRVELS
ncbi:MAG: type III-A CRISPR-associated RAMP protein Csm3 [Chloroflexota bacterium]|nr:type III-A CRISPR-associated RAMP protein Csm3 [Chloroflexota bacterium]